MYMPRDFSAPTRTRNISMTMLQKSKVKEKKVQKNFGFKHSGLLSNEG